MLLGKTYLNEPVLFYSKSVLLPRLLRVVRDVKGAKAAKAAVLTGLDSWNNFERCIPDFMSMGHNKGMQFSLLLLPIKQWKGVGKGTRCDRRR
jgi:hypothetical protein